MSATPKFRDWHFGMWTCAFCLGKCGRATRYPSSGQDAVRRYLVTPLMDGYEVLVPAGFNKFHFECWRAIEKNGK